MPLNVSSEQDWFCLYEIKIDMQYKLAEIAVCYRNPVTSFVIHSINQHLQWLGKFEKHLKRWLRSFVKEQRLMMDIKIQTLVSPLNKNEHRYKALSDKEWQKTFGVPSF